MWPRRRPVPPAPRSRGSSHLAPIAAYLPSREVIGMGRRDLIRRERAKLAAAEARDGAASAPAATLPAWLGTGGAVASSESTWVRSVPSRTTSTPQPPRPAPRRHPSAQRLTDRRPALPPYEGAPLRELVRRRDEARVSVRALDAEIANEVERARAVGAPWTAIAQCLAITRQGARQRYSTGGTHARPIRTWSTDHQ